MSNIEASAGKILYSVDRRNVINYYLIAGVSETSATCLRLGEKQPGRKAVRFTDLKRIFPTTDNIIDDIPDEEIFQTSSMKLPKNIGRRVIDMKRTIGI